MAPLQRDRRRTRAPGSAPWSTGMSVRAGPSPMFSDELDNSPGLGLCAFGVDTESLAPFLSLVPRESIGMVSALHPLKFLLLLENRLVIDLTSSLATFEVAVSSDNRIQGCECVA